MNKYLLLIGVVGVTAYAVAPSLVKRILVGVSPTKSEKDVEKSVDIDVDVSKVKKSNSDILTRAEFLHKSFLGPGTNEEIMFKQLEGLNNEELKELFKVFGVRVEKVFGFEAFKSNLFGWFRAELSDKDYEKVMDIFRPTGLVS